MPGMDGWQVLEQMGPDTEIGDVPVFLVSAQDPVDKPPGTSLLLASIDQGLSISKLLRCSLELSSLLLQPDDRPDPALLRSDGDGRASVGKAQPLATTPALPL